MQSTTPVANSQIRRANSIRRENSSNLHNPGSGTDGSTQVRQGITPNQEVVFQRMTYRKLERQLRGTYKNDKPWTILWTFLTLLLLFGLVAPTIVDYKDEEDNKQPHKRSFDIQVNIRDLGFLSLMAIITVVMLVYTLTRVVVVVRWSLYWLLATLSVLYLWKRQINLFSSDTPLVLLVGFGVLEFLTFFVYILMNFLYPPFIRSEFFRKNVGVAWWFGIKPQPKQHWTLTYLPSSWFEGRRTCTYRGETDAEGLPHGFGNWLDDSFHGELLSGLWEHGEPVGPFRSREFGSGFAFESLRVGYVHCSDDSFTSRMYFPTQHKLPTIGVASVECSVAGGFFSHLPRAVIREGPYCLASVFDDDLPVDIESNRGERTTNPFLETMPHYAFRRVSEILPHIKMLYTEHPSSSLIITATRNRGVLVSGHSYIQGAGGDAEPPSRLLIDVMRDDRISIAADGPPVVAMSMPSSTASSSSAQTTPPPPPTTAPLPTPLSLKTTTSRTDDEIETSMMMMTPLANGGMRRTNSAAGPDSDRRIERSASSVQLTDAPGSSLLLASSSDEEEDGDEEEDEDARATRGGGGILAQLIQQQQLAPRPSSLSGDDSFQTPLLPPATTHQQEAGDDSLLLQANHDRAQLEQDDEALFFNMSHIPAATFHSQLLQQQTHLLHRPHSNVFHEARILVSQQRYPNNSSGSGLNNTTGGASMTGNVVSQVPMMISSPPNETIHNNQGGFPSGPYLKVQGWKSSIDGHVEALIFFPGFNASLEHSLQRLGQFMAMGRFPPHIKPLVFSWPCGRELTYLWAAECATSAKTHAALAALLRGLEESGVRDVHFLVHSLGAQVVCSALRDVEDEIEQELIGNIRKRIMVKRRSEVSKLFTDVLMPTATTTTTSTGTGYGSTSPFKGRQQEGGRGKLRLRTLTLLNPDTPLSSFIHRDFRCLRRVCDHITIVGDRKDGALDWSELGNGFVNTYKQLHQLFSSPSTTKATKRDRDDEGDLAINGGGSTDPSHNGRKNCCGRCGDPDSFCSSRIPFAMCCRSCVEGCCRPYRHGEDRMFSRMLTIGKNIFSLYMRDSSAYDDESHHQQPLLQRGLAAAFRRHKDVDVDDHHHHFELLHEESDDDEEDDLEMQQHGGRTDRGEGRGDMDADDIESPPVAMSSGGGGGGARRKRRKRTMKRWLDVDVIDTSSMETNVHQLRHAYFDLNKILVEDLHELIVTGKRAAERSLLLHREGNIFSFCQAPACVVNQ